MKRKLPKPVAIASAKAVPVYTLKLTLEYISPPIWRRVEVPADWALVNLHDAIQVLMGWHDCHLWHFDSADERYAPPAPDAASITDLAEMRDARKFRLSAILKRVDDRLSYTYDYGDDWHLEVILEEIASPVPGVRYPRCVEGKRAAPPEDCGGPPGYEALVAALADKRHPQHRELKRWVGGHWDARAFDLALVNAELGALGLPRHSGTH